MIQRKARIRTKNPSAKPLRASIITNKRAIVRLGSLTPLGKVFPNRRDVVEINTVEAIQNSRGKIRMKDCFSKLDIPQAEWWSFEKEFDSNKFPYPIVLKRIFGFKGHGMALINNKKEFDSWYSQHKNHHDYFIEKFYNYAREYRIHVASGNIGCFMSWRKLRRQDSKERWFFNSSNCNWVSDQHELFDKPKCWKQMEAAAICCIKSTGLDIGAVDIRVQSNEHDNPKFIVCEINSAPALGEIGIIKYKEIITNLINSKNV